MYIYIYLKRSTTLTVPPCMGSADITVALSPLPPDIRARCSIHTHTHTHTHTQHTHIHTHTFTHTHKRRKKLMVNPNFVPKKNL